MKYAIIQCINGSYSVYAEGYTVLDQAKTVFHTRCATLWNAPDVITATIKIVDENLDNVEGYRDFITHHGEAANEP